MKTGAVAEVLGVSRHVVDMCERGDLPSIKIGAMLTHLLTRPEEVMGLARENIRRWSSMHRTDGKTVEYLREWDSILGRGLQETVDTILSTRPRARELRQNSPFAGVLDQTERMPALRTFREKDTLTA